VRRLLAVVAVVVVLLAVYGCTPAQSRAWWQWHATDPTAAEAFLSTPAGQRLLADPSDPLPGGSAGDCASFASMFHAAGLPVAIFERLAWRESGCNPRSFVDNRTDLGGGLLGLNLRTSSLRSTWFRWCGLTVANVTVAAVNIRCAGVAYAKLGLRPWE